MGWHCSVCGEKTYTNTTRIISAKLRQIYTTCRNGDCQHRELVDISFNKTISPPINQHGQQLSIDFASLINQLPEDQRQHIRSQIN